MKLFLRILSITILGLIAYFVMVSKSEMLAACTLGGLVSGFLWTYSYLIGANDKMKGLRRELEKNSVKSDSSTSKVSVLEAKIQVLEKALKDALG